MALLCEKLACGASFSLSGQPPQPCEIAVYGVWSIWLWLTVSCAV